MKRKLFTIALCFVGLFCMILPTNAFLEEDPCVKPNNESSQDRAISSWPICKCDAAGLTTRMGRECETYMEDSTCSALLCVRD